MVFGLLHQEGLSSAICLQSATQKFVSVGKNTLHWGLVWDLSQARRYLVRWQQKNPKKEDFFLPGSLGPTTLLRLLCLKAVYLPMLPALSVTAAASSGAIGDFGAWGDTSSRQPFPCHPPRHLLPSRHPPHPPPSCLLGDTYTAPLQGDWRANWLLMGLTALCEGPIPFQSKRFIPSGGCI